MPTHRVTVESPSRLLPCSRLTYFYRLAFNHLRSRSCYQFTVRRFNSWLLLRFELATKYQPRDRRGLRRVILKRTREGKNYRAKEFPFPRLVRA